jgi:hypothetical protein
MTSVVRPSICTSPPRARRCRASPATWASPGARWPTGSRPSAAERKQRRPPHGNVEGIRVLGVARTSSIKARTQAMNQLRSLVSTAPAELRERLRALPIKQIVEVCAALRPGADSSVETTTKTALRLLARRVQYLDTEIAELDARRTVLVKQVAPALLEAFGVGPHTAATLLVTVGDNPERQDRRLPPPAPRRRPTSQQRPVDHRPEPHGDPPRHQDLRRTTDQRRQADEVHHALPQAPRRPRNLQAPPTSTSHLDDLRSIVSLGS